MKNSLLTGGHHNFMSFGEKQLVYYMKNHLFGGSIQEIAPGEFLDLAIVFIWAEYLFP